GREIAPQRHHQLARQGDDGDALDALAGIERASAVLLGKFAVRLMPQPQPGQFDCGTAGARIARLADALVAVDATAPPRTGRQPEIACDLAAIAEVLVEHLVGQCRRERRAETFEAEQQLAALDHLRRRRGWIRLVCAVCSFTSRSRSRLARRASSCSAEGTRTIRTTRGSPRRNAISVRSIVSPSIRSVFTRRARWSTAMLAGSKT